MSPLSASQIERARKNERAVLQALASTGQATVGEALGVSESTISRMKEGDIARFSQMLATMGLKIVPQTMRCFPEKEIEAMFTLAKARMAEMDSSEQLAWD